MRLATGRKTVLIGLGAAALVLSLAGCGRIGPLERPAPLFGERAKQEYRQEQDAERAEAARRREANQNAVGSADREVDNTTGADNAPPSTRDVRDENQVLSTPRQAPVAGAPNPLGPPVSTTPQ